jgi:hypothetical protein
MAAKRAREDRLFTTRWVHVAEEDTGEGAVYRPDGDDIPLSRKPRNWLELREDGSARVFVPGPDDRPVEQPATWRDAGAPSASHSRTGPEVTIVSRAPARLVVKVTP